MLEQMKALEDQRKALEQAENQRQEELRKQAENEKIYHAEAKASLTILFALVNLAGALPEDYDRLKANYDISMERNLPRCGAHRAVLSAEAEKTSLHAGRYVEQVREQRARFQAWQERQPKVEGAPENTPA